MTDEDIEQRVKKLEEFSLYHAKMSKFVFESTGPILNALQVLLKREEMKDESWAKIRVKLLELKRESTVQEKIICEKLRELRQESEKYHAKELKHLEAYKKSLKDTAKKCPKP